MVHTFRTHPQSQPDVETRRVSLPGREKIRPRFRDIGKFRCEVSSRVPYMDAICEKFGIGLKFSELLGGTESSSFRSRGWYRWSLPALPD